MFRRLSAEAFRDITGYFRKCFLTRTSHGTEDNFMWQNLDIDDSEWKSDEELGL